MSERQRPPEHARSVQEAAIQQALTASTFQEFSDCVKNVNLKVLRDQDLTNLTEKLRSFPEIQKFEREAATGITIGFPKVWIDILQATAIDETRGQPPAISTPSNPSPSENPWAPPGASETVSSSTFGEQLLAFLKSLGKK